MYRQNKWKFSNEDSLLSGISKRIFNGPVWLEKEFRIHATSIAIREDLLPPQTHIEYSASAASRIQNSKHSLIKNCNLTHPLNQSEIVGNHCQDQLHPKTYFHYNVPDTYVSNYLHLIYKRTSGCQTNM